MCVSTPRMYPQSGYFLVYFLFHNCGHANAVTFKKVQNQLKKLSVMGIPKFTIVNTRKYPLRGYILGVLKHTTAWD